MPRMVGWRCPSWWVSGCRNEPRGRGGHGETALARPTPGGRGRKEVQAAYREWLSRGLSRRRGVVGGILIAVVLGVRSACRVLRSPLIDEFKWDPLTATWPFILATGALALLVIPTGRWNDRVGPRPVGIAGGVLMGVAFIRSSFIPTRPPNGEAAWLWLVATHGIMAGPTMGLAGHGPCGHAVTWFPDTRGLVAGLSMMGVGGSSLMFGPLATTMRLSTMTRPAIREELEVAPGTVRVG